VPVAAQTETVKVEQPHAGKIGDMVKVVDNEGFGPEGHIGKVLKVDSKSVVVETPGGCVYIGSECGWWHRAANVQLVQTLAEPIAKTWQENYLRMQESGIEFLDEGVHNTRWMFSERQSYYKIDLTQTPPVDWQEIYEEAQENGVVFEVKNAHTGVWGTSSTTGTYRMLFGSVFEHYRIKETT